MSPNDHESSRPGQFVSSEEPENPSAETLAAVEQALARTQMLHDDGNLLKPAEAMSMAGPAYRHMETLYSIARKAAFATGGDTEHVLYYLAKKFPTYA